MRFICLSGNPNKPCNIIKFKSTILMLDCALDQTSSLSFLPMTLVHSNHFSLLPNWNALKELNEPLLENEIKECQGKIFIDSSPEFCLPEFSCIDFKHIDGILISNYRSILALPYITERSGFTGFVYATEPSLNLGRLYMEELVANIERNPKLRKASVWKKPNVFNQLPFSFFPESIAPENLDVIYTLDEVNSCLSKVKSVAFSEKISIFGSLQWYPVSSGYCIGSSNWVIESAHEKIVYISSSSTFTTHPRYMDTAPFKNADVLILTSLSQTPHMNPNSKLNDFCHLIDKCVKNGGNVLIPCYPSGVIYDLFECLSLHLEHCGAGNIPIFFISPIAEHSLAYSNIMAEWLSDEKQSRVYIPEEPFPHAHYIRNGRIKYFSSISDEQFNQEFRSPCVVFTGYPSLRFGDVVHFIELWGPSPNNMVLLIEPEFPFMEAMAPFQPLAMKVVSCPIDTRLAFVQANKIIRDLKPTNLLLPYQYYNNGSTTNSNSTNSKSPNETIIETDCKIYSYKRGDNIKLPIKCQYERLYLDSELASQVQLVKFENGISLATVTGILQAKDYKFRLCPITKSFQSEYINQSRTNTLPPDHYLFGNIDIQKLVNLLTTNGFDDAILNRVHDREFYINIPSKSIGIEIDDKSSTIVTEQWSSNHRFQIRNLIAQCLNKL